jgi:tetratricopeptide (TPR) repeat protein
LWHLGRPFVVETDFARAPRRALAKGTAAQTGRRSRAKSALPQFALSGELDALKRNQRVSKLRGLSKVAGVDKLRNRGRGVIALNRNYGAASLLWTLSSLVYCIITIAILFAPTGVAAQATGGQEAVSLEARKDALFQQMLRDPANLDVTFAYADVSTRLGDYEAAVSALERMLLFNSDLPRVQLGLGALYFRMGSFDLAHDYFEKAATGNPPPEVHEKVDQYLAEIEKSQSRLHLSGFSQASNFKPMPTSPARR